jgi:Flp pilus assembly protein TadB
MMKEGSEKESISRLKEDLKRIEDIYETEAPPSFQLMNTLNEFKAERKKASKRELAAFLITALIILALYTTIVFNMSTAFIWIQVVALIVIPVIFIAEKKRRNKLEEVTKF